MQLHEIQTHLYNVGVTEKVATAFLQELKKSPAVWKEFERIALYVISRGKKVGAMAIVNKIRWDVEVESNGEWKVNNNYAPYYGRLFEIKYPQYSGYFEKRALKDA